MMPYLLILIIIILLCLLAWERIKNANLKQNLQIEKKSARAITKTLYTITKVTDMSVINRDWISKINKMAKERLKYYDR